MEARAASKGRLEMIQKHLQRNLYHLDDLWARSRALNNEYCAGPLVTLRHTQARLHAALVELAAAHACAAAERDRRLAVGSDSGGGGVRSKGSTSHSAGAKGSGGGGGGGLSGGRYSPPPPAATVGWRRWRGGGKGEKGVAAVAPPVAGVLAAGEVEAEGVEDARVESAGVEAARVEAAGVEAARVEAARVEAVTPAVPSPPEEPVAPQTTQALAPLSAVVERGFDAMHRDYSVTAGVIETSLQDTDLQVF